MIPHTRIFRKSPDVVSRKIVDEMILVPIHKTVGDTESIYALNQVGARIWELIDGMRRVEEIRDLIVDEFDVSQKTAEEHLLTLLEQFEEIGAVDEVATEAA